MKQRIKWRSLMAIPLFLGLFFFAGVIGANAAAIYGVTSSNQLVRFRATTPGNVTTIGAITGLQAGETVLGIDFRPANGQLYALGSNSRIYRINKQTAAATFVGTLTTTLSGTNFGFDFNPVPDRIRIVSNTGQNLRANPNDGTNVVDGNLAFAAGDPNAGQTPNINGSAYTNSFVNSTSTTLYNIDSNLNILVSQNPPNNGTLNTIGALGVDAANIVGFDHTAASNIAYASLNVGGNLGFYNINLQTGAATLIGALGNQNITDVTVEIGSAAVNRLDFDGDGLANYAVFRPSINTWYILRPNGTLQHFPFGLRDSDILTPADYDGDGITDIAVWRRTNGTWYILRSSDGAVQISQFGSNGDEPVARDYDGDGKADLAVVRRTNGQMIWYFFQSLTGTVRIEQFGLDTDFVAPGDYDGDGRFDLAIFRGGADERGTFFIQQSTAGFRAVQWGLSSDLVVPGDYDGDGKTDLAVVRGGVPYTWYILRSSDNTANIVEFGTKTHFTTQNDYDGDGITDVSVYDPINGIFYVLRSSNGVQMQVSFGQNGDYPIANYDTH